MILWEFVYKDMSIVRSGHMSCTWTESQACNTLTSVNSGILHGNSVLFDRYHDPQTLAAARLHGASSHVRCIRCGRRILHDPGLRYLPRTHQLSHCLVSSQVVRTRAS